MLHRALSDSLRAPLSFIDRTQAKQAFTTPINAAQETLVLILRIEPGSGASFLAIPSAS